MEQLNKIIKNIESRMDGALSSLRHSLNGLRTGRASAALLDPIKVDVYGNRTPINQIATISTPEARLISVQVWDGSNVSAVEKAILESGLGLNPMTSGNVLKLPLPDLSEERRKDLAKKAKEYLEQSKIALRNIRRDTNDTFKQMNKSGEISDDEQRSSIDKIQKITDRYVSDVENLTADKTEEILKM